MRKIAFLAGLLMIPLLIAPRSNLVSASPFRISNPQPERASNPSPLRSAAELPVAPSGSAGLDPAFGGFSGDGTWVSDPSQDYLRKAAVQLDGKLVAGGTVSASWYYWGDYVVRRFLPDGSPDTTFGFEGRMVIDMAGGDDHLGGLAIQTDGKLLLAGSASGLCGLARLNPDGSPDPGFSEDGKAFGSLDADVRCQAAALQPDGKILAAGSADYDPPVGYNYRRGAIFRFTPAGALDTSFDGDGKLVADLGGDESAFTDLALQADGKIVAVGWNDSSLTLSVARYNPDGSPDDSFDGDGKMAFSMGDSDNFYKATIQPDGKILLAGTAVTQVALARILPAGGLDPSFGGDGIVITSLVGDAWDLVVQPDNRIVAAANVLSRHVLLRFLSDGSLDTSFGGDGVAGSDFLYTAGPPDPWTEKTGLVRLPDGRLVLVGTLYNSGQLYQALARYFPDGTLDSGGRAVLDFSPSDAKGAGLAVASDGTIVLAGTSTQSSSDWAMGWLTSSGYPDAAYGPKTSWPGRVIHSLGGDQTAAAIVLTATDQPLVAGTNQISGDDKDFMLGRFLDDGSPDGSFNFVGFNAVDYEDGDDSGVALSLRPDGKIILAGDAWNGSDLDLAVSRFLAGGALDEAFSYDGLATGGLGADYESLRAVALQSDNKIVVAGGYAGDFALRRFYANGVQPPFGGDLDMTFGTLGKLLDDLGGNDAANALLVQPDNSLVAGGYSSATGSGDFVLRRYLPAGAVDTTFGNAAGKSVVNFQAGSDDRLYALAQRSDGYMALTGCSSLGSVTRFAVALLDKDGHLVLDFADSGLRLDSFGGVDDCARSVAFDEDGNILAGGYAKMGGRYVFAVARYLAPSSEKRLFIPLARR